jgi:hypothetical protein
MRPVSILHTNSNALSWSKSDDQPFSRRKWSIAAANPDLQCDGTSSVKSNSLRIFKEVLANPFSTDKKAKDLLCFWPVQVNLERVYRVLEWAD